MLDIADGDIDKAIDAERDILQPIKDAADYSIDTSLMSTTKLRETIRNYFLEDFSDTILVSCVSFGFKYGLPAEADLVFDVRCMPNPFFVPELKEKTGLDAEVQEYVMSHEVAQVMRTKLYDMIDFLLPQYINEGKSQLVIAIGCTGGKHRSVTFAENLWKHLDEKGYNVRVLHRDISKNKQ